MFKLAPARPLLLSAAVALASIGAARADIRPDACDAAARVPAVRYTSALAGFRGLGDVQPTPWREANDTVTRIGGWRAYARSAREPMAAASAAPATGSPQGHAGHDGPVKP